MSSLETEQAFVAGLLDPSRMARGLVAGVGTEVGARYDIYRNNVTVSLINALAATYPAVQRITGPDFFRAMARFHVRATPPRSPMLFEYGREFPDFIERYEYAVEMPWLADVARIERAWLDAYHAADHTTLTADALAAIQPSDLASVRFERHPAARVVRSRFPALSIFTMNKAEGEVSKLRSSEAEDTLITRPDEDIVVSRLPPGGAAFLQRLMAGDCLGDAVAVALDDDASFDLGANLAGMLSAGVLSSIRP